ncbi:MAG: glycerol-3-phosphate dehydrogenase/oxidase [Actinobacteria bacterium]|nr:glycerol-3-phosphate dehydrogenase/oxidase [Actinomycetota bacterium]MBU1942485.1 glycerol-3-phosphate dehydrogenase/oxidase [Actinomycetota bacterium]MBU2686362.1 glycerol-3-phosphate dehydrogenase/oxidase [Actinomycetota bacterium]
MKKTREETVKGFKGKTYDLLVIGGGITGACIARDAALRGFKTACVEKMDWAWGTSSRSSKLIHGGIRYLEMFDFKLVFEACRERRQLLLNAPHLVYPQAFTFPIYKGDKNGIFMIESGLMLYDMLALFRNVQNHRMYLHDKAMELEEGLDSDRLKAAGVFYDCSTDDARLTLAFVLSAIEAGADCANYVEVSDLLKSGERACGARVKDVLTGDEFDIEAKVVVNASGAWGDVICDMDEPGAPAKLQLTKGSHIMVPRGRARTRNAAPVVSPADDRLMFVIPRGKFSLIGTTDTYYHEDLDKPYATREDVEYILEAANSALPRANLETIDIVSTYSGLRPLAMQEGGEDVAASKVSREHRIYQGRSGLLTISGGKLTTGRSMAEEMVDLAERVLSREFNLRAERGCTTMNNPVFGTPSPDAIARTRALSAKLKLDDDTLRGLLKQGTDALKVLAMCSDDESLAEPLSPTNGHIKAQVRFAAEGELARTVEDFLVRRTEIYYTEPDQGTGVADAVADIMGDVLGWDAAERKRQVAEYGEVVALSRRWQAE